LVETAPALATALLSIVLIDLVLSGDNALVIGMAAHRLPPRQRRIAITGGAAAAILLRVTLTVGASLLLQVAYLRLLGGALLLWIAFKLLKEEAAGAEENASPERLRDAILTIVVADFVMSLDNILGVAGAAGGHTGLLLFGLALSMGIMMLGGNLVAALLNRAWWLAYLATAVIAHTGATMILHDPALHAWLALPHWEEVVVPLVLAGVTVCAAHWFHRRSPVVASVGPTELEPPPRSQERAP
jgi:YjbE family integral membrane protein